jgi:hypothetical protein
MAEQLIDATGDSVLHERSIERLQLVADVFAKNLMSSHDDTRLAAIFDRIEPLGARLRENGRAGAAGRELLQPIGRCC